MSSDYAARFAVSPSFPTPDHQAAAEAVVDFWASRPETQAVLLTCSCARGRAVPDSCVDISILVAPERLAATQTAIWPRFERFCRENAACKALEARVPWSGVDADLIDGTYSAGYHGYTSGADAFELEIGNTLAWSHPLLRHGDRWERLQAAWLPYYNDALRNERLAAVLSFARNNIEHIEPYATRGLLHQAHKRLLHASEEYLQALFISRRVYPIAYDKWIREQLVDILDEPADYERFRGLFALSSLDARSLIRSANTLSAMLDAITP